MKCRGLLAGAFALLAATASCASSGESEEEVVETEEEVPLDLTIDQVDVLHGGVRVRATMVDGSPDVSVSLGDACEHREVGRGTATRLSLTWVFDENDIGSAVRCNLVVRARSRVDGRRVRAVAPLVVSPDVLPCAAPDDANDSNDSPERPAFRELAVAATELRLSFGWLVVAKALAVGDRRIPPVPLEDGEDRSLANRFDVPYEEFARALLEDRPLRLEHTAFQASLSIGGVVLDRGDSTAVAAEPETEPEVETDTDVPVETERRERPQMVGMFEER